MKKSHSNCLWQRLQLAQKQLALKKYKTSYPVAFPLSYFEDFILDERPQQMELVVSWLSIFYIKR